MVRGQTSAWSAASSSPNCVAKESSSRASGQLPEALGKTTLMSMGPRYCHDCEQRPLPELWFYDLITYRFDGPVTLVHPALSVAHDASEQRADWKRRGSLIDLSGPQPRSLCHRAFRLGPTSPEV